MGTQGRFTREESRVYNIKRGLRKNGYSVQVMQRLRKRLKQMGIHTEIVTIAKSGSCYVRFVDPRMGQIRIGDHNERKWYGYKWQIRLDLKQRYTDQSKGHKRYFYPPSEIEEAARHMCNYQRVIKKNEGNKNV